MRAAESAPNLECLDLSGNPGHGGGGMAALVAVLPRCAALRTLKLERAALGGAEPAAAAALAAALPLTQLVGGGQTQTGLPGA